MVAAGREDDGLGSIILRALAGVAGTRLGYISTLPCLAPYTGRMYIRVRHRKRA